MAVYRVVYFRQGNRSEGEPGDPEDVHEYVVQVERDGVFLGEWAGTIDARSLYAVAPESLTRFHRNAVLVMAARLRSSVEMGDALEDVAGLIPLSVEEVVRFTPPGHADWQPGDTVVEFEV